MSRYSRKPGFGVSRPGTIQIGLYSHRKGHEACNFRFRKMRNGTFRVAKTKVLISFAVTAKLICAFVFAYSKIRFSHEAAHLIFNNLQFDYIGKRENSKKRLFFLQET